MLRHPFGFIGILVKSGTTVFWVNNNNNEVLTCVLNSKLPQAITITTELQLRKCIKKKNIQCAY